MLHFDLIHVCKDLTDVPGSNPADTLRYDGVVLVMYIRYE